MDKFQAKDLTINVVFDGEVAAEAIIEAIETGIRKAAKCERVRK